jgi:hypothetical protein
MDDPEPPPEPIDWWVWAVRQAAGIVGELLLAARGLIVLVALIKLGLWYFMRNASDLYQAGGAAIGFVAAWVVGIFLGRFSWSRDTPDPMRWMSQRRR